MIIDKVIEHLNKEKGFALTADYYPNIQIWENWWEGFYKPFHEFTEVNGAKQIKRKLYTLKMAKKVCEDWASILLNEKTQIVIDDEKSNLFLQGKNQTGGVFGKIRFWDQANALVEKAFYSGTGAFVLRVNGMTVENDTVVQDGDAKISLNYLNATNIIPLTVKDGKIIEVAFVSEVLEKGKKYIYLESHTLEEGKYVITNQYFSVEKEQLTKVPLPEGIAETVKTECGIPWFSTIFPNIVNNIKGSNGLGISVYANAVDNLMGVDLAFNNFNRDFKLGGKKVFYNDTLVQRNAEGTVITPDDVMQQLFVSLGESELDDAKKLIQEFNPSLRVSENKDGIQAQLDYLSFKVGLGTKHYQFNAGSVVTATQYMGDKQELIQNASKHYIVIEAALQEIVRAVLWVGKEILGQPVNPDANITITFDDSYVIDKESERIRDQAEVRDGLMNKWEYRVKWYGEDEDTAKAMVAGMSDNDLMGFGGGE